MYTELLLGTLLAVTLPQGRDADTAGGPQGIRVPALELEVPAIRVDVPDLYLGAYGPLGAGLDVQGTETDTTFDVNPNAVLSVSNHIGEIVIRTWNRDQVRVLARHSSRDGVKIVPSGSTVRIRSESRRGVPDEVDYEITVPGSMAVDLWGLQADISVDGVGNGIQAETMSGDIDVRNSAGQISLRSVEGEITLARSRGNVEVNGVEGEISVLDFEGELIVESIDGDIRLAGIRSSEVKAKTVDGDVRYDGTITDGGRYRLTTHDGDVVVAIPEGVNATVSVATFDGEFEAAFPVKLERTEAGRRFTFLLGNGSARLELNTFDGDIQLVRR